MPAMALVEILDAAAAPLTALLNNRAFADDDFAGTPITADSLEQWELVNTTGDAHPIHLHLVQYQVFDWQRVDTAGYMAAVYGPGPIVPGTGPYPPPPVTPFLGGGRRPPAANEAGWKDMVVAMPGEVTRILVPFGAGAAGSDPVAVGRTFIGQHVWH
jgi:spore coat protein A, manganese oxidase